MITSRRQNKTTALSRMPFHLELGSDLSSIKPGKAIVVNSQSGKYYSKVPIPLADAKAQLRVLKEASRKKGEK